MSSTYLVALERSPQGQPSLLPSADHRFLVATTTHCCCSSGFTSQPAAVMWQTLIVTHLPMWAFHSCHSPFTLLRQLSLSWSPSSSFVFVIFSIIRHHGGESPWSLGCCAGLHCLFSFPFCWILCDSTGLLKISNYCWEVALSTARVEENSFLSLNTKTESEKVGGFGRPWGPTAQKLVCATGPNDRWFTQLSLIDLVNVWKH